MTGMGGGGLPPSVTVNGGPWEGSYDSDDNPGMPSYWGPSPAGTVQGSGGFVNKSYPLPALHFTINADGSRLHASLDMGGKNAHLHWNGGTVSWDVNALDTDKSNWLQAIYETHDDAVYDALASVAPQFETGVVPAFVAAQATGAESGGYQIDQDDFPPLGGARTQPQAQPEQYAEEQYAPEPAPLDTAYLDEMDGEHFNFAVSDGRSLGIERAVLEAAAAGTMELPESDVWLTVVWADKQVPLPDTLFEAT